MNHLRLSARAFFAAVAGAALLAACGEGGGAGAPSAPSPPAPPPIAAVVSFADATAEAYEGDTVSLPIRYETRNLATAWRLRVSPMPGTAQSADFSLPNAVVEIPAGSGTTGTVTLDLTALADDEFDEGTETFSLGFVPDPAVNAQLGSPLRVSIREGGALVTFAAGIPNTPALSVTEGDAVETPIFYEVRNLAAPLDLRVDTLEETAGPDEFRLEQDSVTLPAGRGVSGSVSVRLAAEEDTRFAEGDETGHIRFVPAEGVTGIRLGADAQFVIRDRGASPCPGVLIRALPPVTLEPGPGTFADGLLFTTLTVTQEPSAAEATLFQRSPYLFTESMAERGWPPVSVLNFADWSVEPQTGATRHSVDLRWPGESSLAEPDLEFGFVGGGCSGDEIAACSSDGCELTSADAATSGGGGR